jgi:hypothetical protein
MAQAKPVFNPHADFGEIIGDPVEKYMQDFHCFDAAGRYVRTMPASFQVGAKKPEVSEKQRRAAEAIAAARARADADEEDSLDDANEELAAQLGERNVGKSVPDTVADASRENAAAARAEQDAE